LRHNLFAHAGLRFADQPSILGRSAETADFQVLTSQGDFLCYRGESSGSGYDAGRAQLGQESLVTSHQGLGRCYVR